MSWKAVDHFFGYQTQPGEKNPSTDELYFHLNWAEISENEPAKTVQKQKTNIRLTKKIFIDIKKIFLSVYVNFLAWPVKREKNFIWAIIKHLIKTRVLSVEQSNSYIQGESCHDTIFFIGFFFWTFLPLGPSLSAHALWWHNLKHVLIISQ